MELFLWQHIIKRPCMDKLLHSERDVTIVHKHISDMQNFILLLMFTNTLSVS